MASKYYSRKMPSGQTIGQYLRAQGFTPTRRNRWAQNKSIFTTSAPGTWTPEMLGGEAERALLRDSGILVDNGRGAPIDPMAGARNSNRYAKTPNQVRTLVEIWQDPAFDPNSTASYYDPAAGAAFANYAGRYGAADIAPDPASTATSPAQLSIVPTSSQDPRRPRTVAAGYQLDGEDSDTGRLTVVFRDGTYYNYYGVPYPMWEAFKVAPSKGRYIRANLDGTGGGGSYDRGPAYVSGTGMDARVRALLYRYASTAQRYRAQGRHKSIQTGKGAPKKALVGGYKTTYGK